MVSFGTPLCTMCNIKFLNMDILRVHMKSVHQESDHNRLERLLKTFEPVQSKDLSNIKSLDCTECGIIFSSTEDQKSHIEEKKHGEINR